MHYVHRSLGRLCSVWIAALLLSLSPAVVFSADFFQTIEIPSSPNPVGSGARAIGMGGAFIGVADDATAASWNPAGLIQLKRPEVSAVGSYFHRIEDNHFAGSPSGNGEQTVSQSDLNYLSAAYPFRLWNRDMVVSANHQNLYNFSRKWNLELNVPGQDIRQTIDFQSDGDLSALGLAYCTQLSEKVWFGVTWNNWENALGKNEWEDIRYQEGTGTDNGEPLRFASLIRDHYEFSGVNFNLGVMWNATGKLTLGAVLKTPFEADLRHERSFRSFVQFPNLPGFEQANANAFEEDATLDMPMSYGIGAAYRFSESLTVSLDVFRTEWDDFVLKDGQGRETSPVTGRPPGESGVDPTHQVRMGAEYIFIQPDYAVPVRCGVFYDPAPAAGEPDDFWGFSLGTGVGFERFVFDVAYQRRFGNNVGGSVLPEFGFSQDVEEHTVYSSLIFYF